MVYHLECGPGISFSAALCWGFFGGREGWLGSNMDKKGRKVGKECCDVLCGVLVYYD